MIETKVQVQMFLTLGQTGSATPPSPPAAPVLMTPSATTVFVGDIVAWTATSSDSDLESIKLVLNPGGSEVILDTDTISSYGGNWMVAQAIGSHSLVARATRYGLTTDSAPVSVTIANPTRQLKSFIASGTWTAPAFFRSPAGVNGKVRARCWGSGGGGTTGVGAGGGGAFSEEPACTVGASEAVTIGAVAVNADGGDCSFGTLCIAKGGKSGATSAGGLASASTGTTKFDGGNGQVGTGNEIGGGGAGEAGAASGTTPGVSTGGFNTVGVAGRALGAGGSSQAAAQFAGGRGEVRVDYDVPGVAGYPRVRARTFGRDAANGTTRNASLTNLGTIVAGEKLIAVVISDGIPVIDMPGWTKLGQENEATSQVSGAWFHLTAAGGETAATITTDASEQVAWEIWRLQGAGTPEFADTNGNSTNADPPSKVYSGGSIKGLVIAAAGWDQPGAITGFPASYDAQVTVPSQSATAPQLCCCELFAETDTFNPGAFTSATEQWVAATIVIPPA